MVNTGDVMKAGIFAIFCIGMVVNGLSVQAEDTADQAAARAALEQKFYELDHPDARSTPDTHSPAAVATPAEPAVNVTNAPSAAPALIVPAKTDFTTKVPPANPSAQTAALAAMQQKMNELDQSKTRPSSNTRAAAAPLEVPANEASAAATPVMETPNPEAPLAVAPAIASAAVAPVSAAPVVVAPAPKVSAAPAAAAVAVVPVANPSPDGTPTQAPSAAALPTSSAGQGRPSNELVTTAGTTYKNVEVQKVTSDGIVISYTPAQGGWAMTRVSFRDLPPDIRQQYEKP